MWKNSIAVVYYTVSFNSNKEGKIDDLYVVIS